MKWLSKWICRLQTHLPPVSGLSSSAEAERKHCSSNNELQARAPLSSCLESVPHASCQICWPGKLSGISMFQLIRVVSRPFHRLEELKEGQTQSVAFIRLLCFPARSPLGLCVLRSYPGDAAPSPWAGGLSVIPISQCQMVASGPRFWGTRRQMDAQPNPWVSIRSGSDPPAPV